MASTAALLLVRLLPDPLVASYTATRPDLHSSDWSVGGEAARGRPSYQTKAVQFRMVIRIEEISRTEENCANAMTVPGIGPLISTAMVAAIGRGESFDKGRDFVAWIGFIPRQYSTGGRTVLGRISKRGSRYLRMLFAQAANVVLMRPHHWPSFSFGDWVARAATRMHRNKLAIALANKLARIAWSVLRHGTPFDAQRDEVMASV